MSRFQSRYFSQLSQQVLRLRDRVERVLRQAKVAAVWGTEILVYPVYAVFQATRLATRQLAHTWQRTKPLLTSPGQWLKRQPPELPAADTPICKTLELVGEFGLGVVTPVDEGWRSLVVHQLASAVPPAHLPTPQATNQRQAGAIAVAQPSALQSRPAPISTDLAPADATPTAAAALATTADGRPVFQPGAPVPVVGIASSLTTRRLVLVSLQNQILDILTDEQQWRLRQRMGWELSAYWRDRRSFHAQNSYRALPLPPIQERPTMAWPIRWLYRLMAWEQAGSVAIATNWFEEATLALQGYGDSTRLRLPEAEFDLWSQTEPPSDPVGEAANPQADRPAATSNQPRALSGQKHRAMALPPTSRLAVASPSHLPVAAPTAAAMAASSAAAQPIEPGAIALSSESAPSSDAGIEPYLETSATLVHYEEHWLEQLLNWLDRRMLWVETHLDAIWAWLGERISQ
ncbi:hypothetical protein ACQ4M4_08555 [Leptolyngbya sp. AN02str]|uniref:hypothetical protein n=1 Tax=Leptolyngbya sp. AN02str TaxID=3423363 RepID=UPI003D318328